MCPPSFVQGQLRLQWRDGMTKWEHDAIERIAHIAISFSPCHLATLSPCLPPLQLLTFPSPHLLCKGDPMTNNNFQLKVFSGRANLALAEKIAQHVGDPLGKIELKNFPDGESW